MTSTPLSVLERDPAVALLKASSLLSPERVLSGGGLSFSSSDVKSKVKDVVCADCKFVICDLGLYIKKM